MRIFDLFIPGHFPIKPRVGIAYWYLHKKTLFFSFDIFSSDSLGGDSSAQSPEVTLALLKDCGLKTETVLSPQAS